MTDSNSNSYGHELRSLFGSYKAEWLRERVYTLFTEPAYFADLKTNRPCVLQGGRGTGKTTVLKGLSYEGQVLINGGNPAVLDQVGFIGLYFRVDTNKVTSFRGPELDDHGWQKQFSHYLNLELCSLIADFVRWHESSLGSNLDLPAIDIKEIASSLNITPCDTTEDLRANLRESIILFQAHINNVADGGGPALSMSGVPVDLFATSLTRTDPFKEKQFFILIDEYENFLDYQQMIVNTLIKHAPRSYTFKVGVRQLGWRIKNTLGNDPLISPADYKLLPIEDLIQDSFTEFAEEVCNSRIQQIGRHTGATAIPIRQAFQSMSDEEEALELGINEFVSEIKHNLKGTITKEEENFLAQLSPLQIYFLRFRAKENGDDALVSNLRYAYANPTKWKEGYHNYKHALLYTIKRGKSGIRKYYCGWNVITQLASYNIRYLLQIVDHCYLQHTVEEGHGIDTQISAKTQTESCHVVARKNLTELEGLTVEGANLTKLLLSLGRIFQVMATEAIGHAPEVNQFVLQRDPTNSDQVAKVEHIITAAVMHLAIIRWKGSKLADPGDTRDYDYMIHPIFCPMFDYSYRRKRKLPITDSEFLLLMHSPKEVIRSILVRTKRDPDSTQLPIQLGLFEAFYEFDS